MRRSSVKIDLQKLSARLLREMGHKLSLGEIHAWLIARGFKPLLSDWWACGEVNMSHLQSDEITHVRLHVSDGIMTFVDHPDPQNQPDERFRIGMTLEQVNQSLPSWTNILQKSPDPVIEIRDFVPPEGGKPIRMTFHRGELVAWGEPTIPD